MKIKIQTKNKNKLIYPKNTEYVGGRPCDCNNRGITLVALILIIIILLILVAVVITQIQNNNIIKYAKDGKDMYIKKEDEEEKIINGLEEHINTNISNSGTEAKERVGYSFGDKSDFWISSLVLKANNKCEYYSYDEENEFSKNLVETSTYTDENGIISIGEMHIKEATVSIGNNSYKAFIYTTESNNPPLLVEIPMVNEKFVGNTYKNDDIQYTVSIATIGDANVKIVYLKKSNSDGSNGEFYNIFYDGNDIYIWGKDNSGKYQFIKMGTFSDDGQTLTIDGVAYSKQ
jgi:hypothetical protein